MDYHVIDNYLPQQSFTRLRDCILKEDALPIYVRPYTTTDFNGNWYPSLNTLTTSGRIKDGVYFTHAFKDFNNPKFSAWVSLLDPFLSVLSPNRIIRMQFNLYHRTFFLHKHKFHIDDPTPHKGCILSLNTNNGRTILKNFPLNIGVKSIENRALFFDPSKPHKGTTCTDADYRANIIVNYE